jgi:hypothetical protein
MVEKFIDLGNGTEKRGIYKPEKLKGLNPISAYRDN